MRTMSLVLFRYRNHCRSLMLETLMILANCSSSAFLLFVSHLPNSDTFNLSLIAVGLIYLKKFPLPVFSTFLLSSKFAIHQHFFKEPCLMIGPGGTILRRSFFEQIGHYPENYGPANDMYFNLKAAAAGLILMLPFTFNYLDSRTVTK